MDYNKLAQDLSRILFEEDVDALRERFLQWRGEATGAREIQLIDAFESRALELRAAIKSPGGGPSREEVEAALRLMFLLIKQGGSSIG